MTARNTSILWAWVAALIGSGLYAPWTGLGGFNRGYGLIFEPPRSATHVDGSRLAIEWILATAVAAALFFTSPRHKESEKA